MHAGGDAGEEDWLALLGDIAGQVFEASGGVGLHRLGAASDQLITDEVEVQRQRFSLGKLLQRSPAVESGRTPFRVSIRQSSSQWTRYPTVGDADELSVIDGDKGAIHEPPNGIGADVRGVDEILDAEE